MAKKNEMQIILDLAVQNKKEVAKLTEDLKKLTNVSDQTDNSFSNVTKGVIAGNLAMAAISKTVGIANASFDLIKNTVRSAGEEYLKFEDAVANVKKTTGLTAEEIKIFQKELLSYSKTTRTSIEELTDIATVGGQLGIAKDDISDFTQAIDKLNVSLGDEFTGGAEEVTKAVGTVRNIFGELQTDNIQKDFLSIGNSINELGAAGFATGPVLVDFAGRIGGLTGPLGHTAGDVLGLSAALQELNITAERGGSNVGRIFQAMSKDAGMFADLFEGSEMGFEGFYKLVNTDINEAFLVLSKRILELGESNTELATLMDDLELNGSGVIEVMQKVGQNTDLVREKQLLANTALQSTNSIMQEYETKNTTGAASIAKFQNSIQALKIEAVDKIKTDFVDLYNNNQDLKFAFDEITGAVEGLGTYIRNEALNWWEGFKTGIVENKDQLLIASNIVKEDLVPNLESLISKLTGGKDGGEDFAKSIMESIPKLANFAANVASTVQGLIDLKNWLTETKESMEVWGFAFGRLDLTWKALTKKTKEVGAEIPNSMSLGVKENEEKLYSSVENMSSQVPMTIKKNWEINSPSKLFKRITGFAVDGLKEGFEERFPGVLGSISEFTTDVTGFFGIFESAVSKTTKNSMASMNEFVQYIGSVKDELRFSELQIKDLEIENMQDSTDKQIKEAEFRASQMIMMFKGSEDQKRRYAIEVQKNLQKQIAEIYKKAEEERLRMKEEELRIIEQKEKSAAEKVHKNWVSGGKSTGDLQTTKGRMFMDDIPYLKNEQLNSPFASLIGKYATDDMFGNRDKKGKLISGASLLTKAIEASPEYQALSPEQQKEFRDFMNNYQFKGSGFQNPNLVNPEWVKADSALRDLISQIPKQSESNSATGSGSTNKTVVIREIKFNSLFGNSNFSPGSNPSQMAQDIINSLIRNIELNNY